MRGLQGQLRYSCLITSWNNHLRARIIEFTTHITTAKTDRLNKVKSSIRFYKTELKGSYSITVAGVSTSMST